MRLMSGDTETADGSLIQGGVQRTAQLSGRSIAGETSWHGKFPEDSARIITTVCITRAKK